MERVISPESRHGLDWNVFTLPSVSPLAFLDDTGFPTQEFHAFPALSSGSQSERPSTGELERRALAFIVAIIGGTLLTIRFIHRFHAFVRS